MNKLDIIFKARRKDTGEWVEGNYFHNKRKGEYHAIIEFSSNNEHKIYRESLEMKYDGGEYGEI